MPHPLERAIQRSPYLHGQFEPLLVRAEGPLSHRQASDRAFAVTQDLRGRRILLLDDTFTTGAALQSAASCLAQAGAKVVAAVVVGRIITPDFSPEANSLWRRMARHMFDFERCCLCANDHPT